MIYRRQSNTFRFEEDTFPENSQNISKILHKEFLIMKFPQTNLQVQSMNLYFDDLYSTVIENGNQKEEVKEEHIIDISGYSLVGRKIDLT